VVCSIACYRTFHGIDRDPISIDDLLDQEVIA
jgi:hypothetical protein